MIHLGVVIPAGPHEAARDTVESVLAFVPGPKTIVVVDNSGGRAADELAGLPDEMVRLPADAQPVGHAGGLCDVLGMGYSHLVHEGRADMVLRMDTDALIIGHGLVEWIADLVDRHPLAGMFGANRWGPDGGRRDFSWPSRKLARECGPIGFRFPRLRRDLRGLRRLAVAAGYEPGEHPCGGAYIMTADAITALAHNGLLERGRFTKSGLAEDHLYSLAIRSLGIEIADTSGPTDPMCIKWRGLAMSPPDLTASGKLLVHSIRFADGWSEEEIRNYFRAHRG